MASPQNSPATLGAARTRQMASVAWSRTDKLQQAYRGPTPPQSQPGKNSQLMPASDLVQEKKNLHGHMKRTTFAAKKAKNSPSMILNHRRYLYRQAHSIEENSNSTERHLVATCLSFCLPCWMDTVLIQNMLRRRAMMQEHTNTPWSGKSIFTDLDLQKVHLHLYVYTNPKRSNSIPIIISLSSTTDNEPL